MCLFELWFSQGICPIVGFHCGSAGKESPCNAGGLGLIPGLGRSPGEGKGYPLQYSGLQNSMDYTIHGVTKSWTQLNDFAFAFSFSCPVVGLLGHMIVLLLAFLRKLYTVLHSGCISWHFHQQYKRVPFSPHMLSSIYYLQLFDDDHYDMCEVT